MGQILAKGDQIGFDRAIIYRAWHAGADFGRQMRHDRVLKLRQGFNGFGQEPIATCLHHRCLCHRAIGTRCAEQDRHTWAHRIHARDQVKPGPIGQAQIDDGDGRPVDMQMPLGRTDAIGPPDPRA